MDVSQIPLPDQQPAKLDISQFPFEILQSQAVADLVSQNEDLMARLSINLKRNAEMESRLLQEAQKLRDTQRRFTLLNDQVLILKEKNRTISEKQDNYVGKIVELERQVKEQSELHVRTRLALENQIEALQSAEKNTKLLMESAQENYARRLGLFNRYHRRIRKYIAPQLIQLKSQFMQLIDDTESLKSDWYQQRLELDKKLSRLTQFHRRVQTQFHPRYKGLLRDFRRLQLDHDYLLQNHLELKAKQDELLGHIAQQNREIANQNGQIEALTITIANKNAEIQKLNEINQQKQKRLEDQDLKMIELENKVIESSRRFSERSDINKEEIVNMQVRINELKDEKARLEVLAQSQNEKIEILEQLNRDGNLNKDRLESENASLRALWSDHRQKAEELKLQEGSLKALNQELMDKLREERLASEKLRSQLNLIETGYQKRLGEVESQLTFLNNSAAPAPVPTPLIDEEQMQRLAKMDALIAEIQTGFSVKPKKIIKNDLPQDL